MIKPAMRLILGGVLAATLGYGAAEAATITLSFGDFEGGSSNTFDFAFPDEGDAIAGVKLELTFEEIAPDSMFDVIVTASLTTQDALGGRLDGFAGHRCVPIADAVDDCVEFSVEAPDPGETTWTGFYVLQIIWAADTDGEYFNDPGGLIRVLHNRGDTEGDAFDTDITYTEGNFGYFAEPGLDPWIFGRDNNFQSFIVTQASPIPEPGTLVLLGGGLAAFCWRRRAGRRAGR